LANVVQNIVWTPSKLIARLGREIDNPESVYYWCYKVSLAAVILHCSFFVHYSDRNLYQDYGLTNLYLVANIEI